MAKSSRSSAVKKNNQRLKKNVFGPVETARNDRLSAKLLELASQPKPPRTEMEAEQSNAATSSAKEGQTTEDVDMDADDSNKATVRSNSQKKKQREAKAARVDKHRHRRNRNAITFPIRHLKSKKGKKT